MKNSDGQLRYSRKTKGVQLCNPRCSRVNCYIIDIPSLSSRFLTTAELMDTDRNVSTSIMHSTKIKMATNLPICQVENTVCRYLSNSVLILTLSPESGAVACARQSKETAMTVASAIVQDPLAYCNFMLYLTCATNIREL